MSLVYEDRSSCSEDKSVNGIKSVISLVYGATELLFMFGLLLAFKFKLIVNSWYNSEVGVKDNATMILPIYYPVFFYTIAIGIYVGFTEIFGLNLSTVPVIAVKWIILRFCSDGLAIFFLHNGIGSKAIRHALFFGSVWALAGGLIPLTVYYSFPSSYNYDAYVICCTVCLGLLDVFYLLTWLLPQRILHRRPALTRFAMLNSIVTTLYFLDYILILRRNSHACAIIFFSDLYDFLQPFIIISALRKDTLFWQGLYTTPHANLNQPFLGVWELGRDTITCIADTIHQLEVRVVPIIPFGQLRVDTSKFFSGGTARVYRGQFKQYDVALKFLFNMELTPANVVSFCDEATMLNSLQHPNIVKCYGVAVMPPAMCLVTEFCEYGSLFDFLHTLDFAARSRAGSAVTIRPHASSYDSSTSSSRLTATKISELNTSPVETSDAIAIDIAPRRSENRSSEGTIELAENETGNPSSVFTGSTLEKMGSLSQYSESFPINLRRSSQTLANNTKSNRNLQTGQVMKSAISAMRSEMNYGLGHINSPMTSRKHLFRGREVSKSGSGTKSILATVPLSDVAALDSPLPSNKTISATVAPMHARSSLSASNSSKLILPLVVKFGMAKDCAAGVAYLHSNGLMHCDIKSLNFLVTKDLVVKLADLGEARPVNVPSTQFPNNINWSSPEVLSGQTAQVNQAADIWSLAFVISEIFTGKVPFDSEEFRMLKFDEYKARIESGVRPYLPRELLHAYPWFEKLMTEAWDLDPTKRISALEMVHTLETNIRQME